MGEGVKIVYQPCSCFLLEEYETSWFIQMPRSFGSVSAMLMVVRPSLPTSFFCSLGMCHPSLYSAGWIKWLCNCYCCTFL
ncbi:Uncharacterized protein APZ42_014121 [Daphnia magna]|uniref:Uncharacterized protein n=1 Tax=Daphnia magna TaxID=35525 RepID=A0A162PYW9_9CRUS|nr:Uncharacterized protein APZ42_014121 [Daphnia magna]